MVHAESITLTYAKILESLTLTAVSIAFDYIFVAMTKEELYTNINSRNSSLLWKIFFWKFFISTILPTIQNTKIFRSRSIGFDDYTPSWYLIEGSSIILSFYIRCFMIVVVFLNRYYMPKFWQGWDQSFSQDCCRTKQKTHQQYISVYKNPTF